RVVRGERSGGARPAESPRGSPGPPCWCTALHTSPSIEPCRAVARPAATGPNPAPGRLSPRCYGPVARMSTVPAPFLILAPQDHVVLGESDFGMPGLTAAESIGPFVGIQASGPLITVHDSVISAGMGIGHHPHRYNERLFYIEQGQLDHDDSLNHITGHMDAGDVG